MLIVHVFSQLTLRRLRLKHFFTRQLTFFPESLLANRKNSYIGRIVLRFSVEFAAAVVYDGTPRCAGFSRNQDILTS
jgi:hypothetical protein